MVCWLKFLPRVSEMLKDIEPNLYRRKQLAISVLKELEREKGHNIAAIEKVINDEGAEGIKKRARKRKRKKEKKEERIESEAIAAEAYS